MINYQTVLLYSKHSKKRNEEYFKSSSDYVRVNGYLNFEVVKSNASSNQSIMSSNGAITSVAYFRSRELTEIFIT